MYVETKSVCDNKKDFKMTRAKIIKKFSRIIITMTRMSTMGVNK